MLKLAAVQDWQLSKIDLSMLAHIIPHSAVQIKVYHVRRMVVGMMMLSLGCDTAKLPSRN